jgi:biotin carboxyl carrier protein
MGFVTELSTVLDCERVSIGFINRKNVRVLALSHSAEFGKRTNLLRAIEAAMDEAVDQQSVVVYPPHDTGTPLVTRSHDELAKQHDVGAICTIPLTSVNKFFGALTLERAKDKPFDEPTLELLKTLAVLAGPILENKRKDERWITTKVAQAAVAQLKKLLRPGHFGLKVVTIFVVAAIIFFIFAKGDHRVKAPTVLEGIVQRTVGAPFSGFIIEASARPGDVVHQGDLLARLDDRDLKLERLKWSTQRDQFSKQLSEAMAKHVRAEALINEAKIDQALAQVSLIDEQLSRTKILAPFDGVVTSGDFSQSLGTPVERGQVLFEVAPLRGYRVIVQVDERDIGWVATGQSGVLALPSVPGTLFPLKVTRITPISTAKEGRNYFRVEAELTETSPRLRPGMEGVGKITSGRYRLAWIWTHEVTEWIRLKVWSWWP